MTFSDLHPMWRNRLEDMIRGVTYDGNGFCEVSDLRIARDWPMRGTARFTRDTDGQRFKAFLTRNRKTWRCIPA